MTEPAVYPCCGHWCSEYDEEIDHRIPCDEPGCPGGVAKGEIQ